MAKHLVFISNPSEEFIKEIKKVLSSHEIVSVKSSTAKLNSLSEFFTEKKTTVLILGPGWEPEDSLNFASDFSVRFPFISIIMVVRNLSTDLLKQSIKSGIKDILELPLKVDSFLASLETASQYSSGILKVIEKTPATDLKLDQKGQVITVFSTKGGVGKTVISTNLGVCLSSQKKSVYLVDLDLQFGDVAVMLKLNPDHGIYEAARAGERLDKEMLESIYKVHESGLKALLAPIEPDVADMLNKEQIISVIEFLKKIADYIIIDTPASINDMVLATIDISDFILLVATMDLPSVKNAKVAHSMLKMLKIPDEKVKLILNRADSKVGISIGDVEKAIGLKVFSSIPSDRLVPRSVNLGIPAVISFPKTEVSRSFEKLGNQILKGAKILI